MTKGLSEVMSPVKLKDAFIISKTEQLDNDTFAASSQTDNETHKNLHCPVCNKVFRYSYTLMRHMPVHTKERNYKCDICSKAFRQMSTLSQHKATHSSAKPYSCNLCGKSFNRGSTLISHKKTHQDLKKYSCSVCNKAFHQKGNLLNHMYTHTNERPYKCDLCSQGFNQKSNLVCHMFTFHGLKKHYSCDLCPASFARENAYKTHIINHKLNISTSTKDYQLLPNSYETEMDGNNKENNNEEIDIKPLSNASYYRVTGTDVAVKIDSVKTPKKPGLKIPATPNKQNFIDLTKKLVLFEFNNNVTNEITIGGNIIKSEFTDISTSQPSKESKIADMGRNLLIREKPPYILEEIKLKGETPFVLIVEHGLKPRLCKASLGTESYIIVPVTYIDMDKLYSKKACKFQIPIFMTVKREKIKGKDLKTHIFIHRKPIELDVLLKQNESSYNKKITEDNEIQLEINSNPKCFQDVFSTESNLSKLIFDDN